MSTLNPEAAPFVLPPQTPPSCPAVKPARQKSGRQKSGERQPNPAPKKAYTVESVNVSGLNYSPTGGLYSAATRSNLARNNYAPSGALYSPWARNVCRLAMELTPAKREAIIKQVEFYFGDSNFSKDKFLQKEVKKRADEYVSLKVIASFNKLKKLTGSWRLVAKAVECSAIVELNVARNSIRRRHKLPDPKMNPTWNRTVVVDNMSRNSSIEDVRSKFAVAGKVEHVRMIDAKKVPDDITTYLNVIKNPNRSVRQAKGYTLVEYASAAEAQAACGMLTDETNWRNGLRVSMLLPAKVDFVNSTPDTEGIVSPDPVKATEPDGTTGSASADRKARRLEKLYNEHPELATVNSSRKARPRGATSAVMPPGILRMPTRPDGTRGFTGVGRGKTVSV